MKGGNYSRKEDKRQPEHVPEALLARRTWVLWRYVVRDGKKTKVPFQPDGRPAKANDPTTWVDYFTALNAFRRGGFDGLGVILGDGLAGIDIDYKNHEGDGIPPEVQAVLNRFASYAELSPSGKGIHILLLGRLPSGARNRTRLAEGVDLEAYDGGRFFTFTGQRLNGFDIVAQQAELEALLRDLGMVQEAPAPAPQPSAQHNPVEDLPDEELLRRMFASKDGADIKRLWEGDWSGYPSQSEADMALVSHLLWWTGGDTARADRLFRRSKLYRPKWDERHYGDGRTYGQATLEKARATLTSFYNPQEASRRAHPLDGLDGGGEVLPGFPRYRVQGGAIHAARVEGKGETRSVTYWQLANFACVIAREVHATDGLESETLFEVDGYLWNGQPLPRARVRAEEFSAMNWPVREWGARVVVTPGQGSRDHLRAAIQYLSQGRVESATVFRHLGWTKLGERWVYLHAGGAITDGEPVHVEVDPGRVLEGFVLPNPPDEATERERVRQLWGLLEVAPHRVTVPLLLYALGAPLGHAPFSLYLAGPTGARKTSLALVVQSLFGYKATTPPIGWEATPNSLEGAAFHAKDCLLLVDDYAPTGSERAQKELQAKAARVLRSQGNAVGRLRMRSDGSLAGDRPPRGSLLVTGEDLPPGHSVRARVLFLELRHGEVDLARLTEAQRLARRGVYAEAMAGWIRYLAGNLEEYQERLRTLTEELRAQWVAEHGRTTDALARLHAAWVLFREYAEARGVDLAHLEAEVLGGLKAVQEEQSAYHRDVDPVQKFLNALFTSLRMGRAHMTPLERGLTNGIEDVVSDPTLWGWQFRPPLNDESRGVWLPQGSRIGWLPEDWEVKGLYLDPSAAWGVANRLAIEQGEPLPTERTLWKLLAERGGISVSNAGGKQRFKVLLRVGDSREWVVHILPHHIPGRGEEGEPGDNPKGAPPTGGAPGGGEAPEDGGERVGADATPWDILREMAEDVVKRIDATGAPFFAVEVDGVVRLEEVWPWPVFKPEEAPQLTPVEFLAEKFEAVARDYPASQSVRVGVRFWVDDFEPVAEVRRDGDGWRLEVYEDATG